MLDWQWALLAGVAGVIGLTDAALSLVALACVAGCALLFALPARRLRLTILLLVAFCAGLGYAHARLIPIPHGALAWENERVPVSARITEVRRLSDGRARLVLDDVTLQGAAPGEAPPGMTLTWQYAPPDILAGQTLIATLRPKPTRGFVNPTNWDSRLYWARHGVTHRAFLFGDRNDAVVRGEPTLAASVRRSVRQQVRAALAQAGLEGTPAGGLLLALTTGDRSGIGLELRERFVQAGLAHTLALSGLHVSLVAGIGALAGYVLGWLWPSILLVLPRTRLALVCAAPVVGAYVFIGGATASLTRAGLMFAAFAAAHLLGRNRSRFDGLFAAVAVLLLADPLAVYDVGLQLSACAVAAILLAVPHIGRLTHHRPWPVRVLVATAGTTIAATLGTWPLIATHFGRLADPLVSVVANMAWLPVLAGVVMPLGLAGTLAAQLNTTVGAWIFGVDGWLTTYALSAMEWAQASGWLADRAVIPPSWPVVAGFVLVLLAVVITSRLYVRRAVLAGVGSVLLVVGLWPQSAQNVTLTLVDVSQGQAVIITEPDGAKALIDAGGFQSDRFDTGEALVAPALGAAPDVVLVSHPDRDHSGGIPFILRTLPPRTLVQAERFVNFGEAQEMADIAHKHGTDVAWLADGDSVSLSSDVTLTILHPARGDRQSSDNDGSLVVRVDWQGQPLALLPGDLAEDGIERLMGAHPGVALAAEVLVMPHHGSATGADPHLYAAVAPQVVVGSMGYANQWGFPTPEVLDRAREVNARVYTTADHGRVDVVWDAPDSPARIVPYRRNALDPLEDGLVARLYRMMLKR